jgi:hypothetical protein
MSQQKILYNIPNKFLKRKTILGLCFFLNLVCSLLTFFRAYFNPELKSWYYSEFLINYSVRFSREELIIKILEKVYSPLNINAYIFLFFVFSAIIIFNLIWLYFLLSTSKVDPTAIIMLSFCLLLFNAVFLPMAIFRMDWFIIFGLLFHAVLTRLVLIGTLSPRKYITTFIFLVIYSNLLILIYEINFLFLAFHFFMFKNIVHYFTNKEKKLIKILFSIFASVQFLLFILLIHSYGITKQVNITSNSLLKSLFLDNVIVISLVNNQITEQFTQISNTTYFHNFISFLLFLIGPLIIYFLLSAKGIVRISSFYLILVPLFIFSLISDNFFSGIILINFTTFILLISDWDLCAKFNKFAFNLKNNQ